MDKRVRIGITVTGAIAILVISGLLLAQEGPSKTGRQGQSTSSVTSTTSGTGQSSTSATTGQPGTVQYVTNSAPTSQWLIVSATTSIVSVSTSNTGTVPEVSSLASLNATIIGDVCQTLLPDGSCETWVHLQETGWYWAASSDLLYVHYLGGQGVTITVVEAEG